MGHWAGCCDLPLPGDSTGFSFILVNFSQELVRIASMHPAALQDKITHLYPGTKIPVMIPSVVQLFLRKSIPNCVHRK